jgi:hypothetical protein
VLAKASSGDFDTEWVTPAAGGGASAIDDLSDVDTTTAAPTDGQALVWDSANSVWVPGNVAAGGGPQKFRYWRLQIDQSGTQNSTIGCIAEIEFREEVGGADVTGSGTASASTSDYSTTPDMAFDNNLANFWGQNTGAAAWIQYDFGAGNEKWIKEYRIVGRDGNEGEIQTPQGFTLQYSADGTTWVDADIRAGEVWGVNNPTRDFVVDAWQPGTEDLFRIKLRTASFSLISEDFDGNRYVEAAGASTITITIPSGLTTAGPLIVERTGAGAVTFAAGAGVTINSAGSLLDIGSQFGAVTVIPKGGDVYALIGDLA